MYDQLKENIIHAQEIAKTSSWTYDIQKDEYFYTIEIFSILGCKFEEFDYKLENYLDFMHPEYIDTYKKICEYIKECREFDVEYKIITKNGEEKYIHERSKILYGENRKPIKLIGIVEDITETRLYQDNLKKIGDQLNYAQRISGVGSFRYDAIKNEVIASEVALSIYDESKNNNNIESYIKSAHPDDQLMIIEATENCLMGKSYSIKYRIPQRNKTNKYVLAKGDPLYDKNNKIVGIIGSIQDITKEELLQQELEKKNEKLFIVKSAAQEANKKLERLAKYDELTGLPNRHCFKEKISSLYKHVKENNTRFALMMLDIEGLDYINYSLGFEASEKALIEVVSKVRSFLGEGMFLSRYSDNHFALIVQGRKTKGDYDKIAEGLINLFKNSFKVDNFAINLTINIGICIYDKEIGADSYIRNAKLALMRARKEGKNRYVYFFSDLDIQSYKEFSLISDMKSAIEKDQLRAYYQPIIDLRTNMILAAEALIRWEHPQWGLVYPTDFIELAEETDCIIDISNWILREVLKNLKKWQDSNLPSINVSINISPIQFMERNFVENFEKIIQEYNVDPSILIVEITENTLLENSKMVISNLRRLKSLGVQVALDDYGTGYSSLSYLTRFDIDIIKIDESFIRDISNETTRIVVKNIINLAKDLDIKLVAEGIEEWAQLRSLKEFKCYLGQGYIYSRPLPIIDFEKILKTKECKPMLTSKDMSFDNRRKYFRVEFIQYLEAYLTIKEIEGRPIDIGNSKILVKNIGPGGLCFIANIRLPLDKDFLVQFQTQVLEEDIKVNGKLVWDQELGDNLYRYGVEFVIDEDDRTYLIKILNEVQIRMKADILFTDANFTSLTPTVYFNRYSDYNPNQDESK